jgi:hypothetical protein
MDAPDVVDSLRVRDLLALVDDVCKRRGVTLDEVCGRTRSRAVSYVTTAPAGAHFHRDHRDPGSLVMVWVWSRRIRPGCRERGRSWPASDHKKEGARDSDPSPSRAVRASHRTIRPTVGSSLRSPRSADASGREVGRVQMVRARVRRLPHVRPRAGVLPGQRDVPARRAPRGQRSVPAQRGGAGGPSRPDDRAAEEAENKRCDG